MILFNYSQIYNMFRPDYFCWLSPESRGSGSSVGVATDYGLDVPGIKFQWGEIFRTSPDRPWGTPSVLYNGYRVLPGGKAAEAWC
jgi:hypothetical protein